MAIPKKKVVVAAKKKSLLKTASLTNEDKLMSTGFSPSSYYEDLLKTMSRKEAEKELRKILDKRMGK
jgi:hypothetical protein